MSKLKDKLGIIHTFDEVPTPIKKKSGLFVLASATAIFAMILLLTDGIILPEDRVLMVMGMIIIASVLLAIAAWIYVVGAAGKYYVITGICTNNSLSGGKTAMKLYSAAKHNRMLQIEGNDGKAYVLYSSEKKKVARIGYPLKIYVSEKTKPVLKDGEYHLYNYLAIESTGSRHD